MSRIRYLKPGFFLDDDLAQCQPLARILFAGLWCIADREGRLEDRPQRIRAEVLPYEDVDTDALLQELADHGSLIVRYAVNGRRYIAIPGFSKHQKPHCRELPSVIPAPPEHDLGSAEAASRQCPSTTQARGNGEWGMGNGEGNGLDPLSGAKPAPDERDVPAGESEETEVLEGELVPAAPSKRETAADASFDRFWAAYPRHEDRKRARTAWTHINAGERELAIGVAGIMSELIAAGRQERRFAPLATTFIRGKRWEDWREGVPAAWAGEGASRAAAQADAYNRALQRARERERAT